MMRQANVERQTKETNVSVCVNLDGEGKADVSTGIGFFDHMLVLFAKHSQVDLVVKAQGDLETGDHHTVEDVGIVLGQAIRKALGEKRGIFRYGEAKIPMDEALAESVLDLSGRPFFVYWADFTNDFVGSFSTQMTGEFFRSLSLQAGMTLHLSCLYGQNDHHKIEALFKAFALSFRRAAAIDAQAGDEIPSSKGIL